ncbi:MAG: flagellar basal body rod protein FlgB [Planctomycetota bacterium]|jgi:flagellar basal-body rod protein FlgB
MSKIDNSNIMNLLEAGIKSEGLRQKAIAGNVANLETPGYRRVDVNFKELLEKAMQAGEELDINDVESYLYRPETTAVGPNGNDVSLEVEIGQMVKNTLQHKTYIRLLQKKYAQMDLAMNVR